MINFTIYYSPTFYKQYKRLPDLVKIFAHKKEYIFKQNPFDPRLHTHKLQGQLAGFWSFSINYHYRIIFEFVNASAVQFHSIGTHEIYER